MKLIYDPSRDGWSEKDFHRLCDNQGPTLSLIQSSAGKICGGFTSVDWKKKQMDNSWEEDRSSFIFSLDDKVLYKPKNFKKAIFQKKGWGPSFGEGSLALCGNEMNGLRNGRCFTVGRWEESDVYEIPEDDEGNSILTGEGHEDEGGEKFFTCVALEVYKLF